MPFSPRLTALFVSTSLACAAAASGLPPIKTSPGKPAQWKDAPMPRAAAASEPAAAREDLPTGDPLDRLRVRLAEKLGARVAADGSPDVVKVAVSSPAGQEVPRRAGASAGRRAASAARAPAGAPWSYEGDTGPAHWSTLRPEYALCGQGRRQSPIDIRDGIAVDLDPIGFDYKPSPFGVINTGRTVRVNVEPGSFIDVMGRRFQLEHMEFRRPAEERIAGRQFDMGVHLVHKDAEGRAAVVAVLLDRGAEQPVVQSVWNNLPLEQGDELRARAGLDVAALLPADRRYFTYMGSMTTPPCREGVLWMVMKSPVAVSSEQLAVFARLYPMNARPLQAAADRLIKGPQ